jgi:hypothetical protein
MAHSIFYPKLIYGFTHPNSSHINKLSYQNELSIYTQKLTVSEQSGNITSHQIIYGIELEIDDQTGIPFISENIKNKVFQVYQKMIEYELNIDSKFNMSNIKLGYHLAISGDI